MAEKRGNKVLKGFRFSESTMEKLDALYQKEKEHSEAFGYRCRTVTDIVEEAINVLYLKELNQTTDTLIFDQLGQVIDDKLKLALQGFSKGINHILYEQMKNNEYWNVLMQTSITGNVSEEKINEIVQGQNPWVDTIEMKLADTFRKM